MKVSRFTLGAVLGVVLMMALAACGPTRESYLQSFTYFVEDVEQNCSSYTDEDWEQKNMEFAEFTGVKKDKVKDKLTAEDQRLIGELETRYQKAKVIDTGNDIIDLLKEGCEYGKGVIDGIFGSDDKEEKK